MPSNLGALLSDVSTISDNASSVIRDVDEALQDEDWKACHDNLVKLEKYVGKLILRTKNGFVDAYNVDGYELSDIMDEIYEDIIRQVEASTEDATEVTEAIRKRKEVIIDDIGDQDVDDLVTGMTAFLDTEHDAIARLRDLIEEKGVQYLSEEATVGECEDVTNAIRSTVCTRNLQRIAAETLHSPIIKALHDDISSEELKELRKVYPDWFAMAIVILGSSLTAGIQTYDITFSHTNSEVGSLFVAFVVGYLTVAAISVALAPALKELVNKPSEIREEYRLIRHKAISSRIDFFAEALKQADI